MLFLLSLFNIVKYFESEHKILLQFIFIFPAFYRVLTKVQQNYPLSLQHLQLKVANVVPDTHITLFGIIQFSLPHLPPPDLMPYLPASIHSLQEL